MVVNLSKFDGIPTTLFGAKRQFVKIFNEEKNRPFNRGRWLVLKREKSGLYKGLWSTYVYETKPTFRTILIKRFPKRRR